MAFQDADGRLRVIQPKSFTLASRQEEKQLQDLLFTGEYVLTVIAMPVGTKEMKRAKGE